MGAKQQTIAILVLVVSLFISGCEPRQASAPSLTPTPIPPTLTQKPALIPSATPSPLPVPTSTSEPASTITASACPGSPYSVDSTDYTLPADTSSKLKSLIQQLSSPDPLIRISAATSIKETGPEALQAMPFLVVLSRDETKLKWQNGFSTTPGAEAINAIADIKGECAFLALKTIAEGGDQIARGHAVQVLGNTIKAGALKVLYDLLHDPNFQVRYNALYSLGTLISNQVYDDALLENLVEVATNSNEADDIRFMAEKDIGLVGINQPSTSGQAIDVLLLLTKDPKPSIRSDTAQVLRDFKDPTVIETLIFLLQDQNSLVTFYAADSLAKMTGKNFGKDYGMWKAWWSTQQ